jgi:hypothetical protein
MFEQDTVTRCRATDVGGLYEQLASSRSANAARELLAARTARGRRGALLAQIASALKDAAGVISLLADEWSALADVSDEVAGQAASLVSLAATLEQAADLDGRC